MDQLSSLPKVYRLEGWLRVFVVLGWTAVAAILLACAWSAWHAAPDEATRYGGALFFAVLAVAWIVMCWAMARRSVVLHADRVEVHEGSRTLVMYGHELAEILRSDDDDATLVSRDPLAKRIEVPGALIEDGAALPWIAAALEAQAARARAEHDEFLADPRLGQTPAEREQWLHGVKRAARWLEGAGVALILWVAIYPHPYELLIAVALVTPMFLIGFIAATRPILRVAPLRHRETWSSLDLSLFATAFMLALLAYRNGSIFDWQGPAMATIAGAALFIPILGWADPTLWRRPGAFALMVVMVGATYAFGASGAMNRMLDTKPGARIEASVLKKHVNTRRGDSYHLTLAPWGPRTRKHDVSVPRELYDAVEPGGNVCVTLKQGYLGWRWYWVGAC